MADFKNFYPNLYYNWLADGRRYVTYSFDKAAKCPLDLSEPAKCHAFSHYIGEYSKKRLIQLKNRVVDSAVVNHIDNVLAVIDRKIDRHLLDMVQSVEYILSEPTFLKKAQQVGFKDDRKLKNNLYRIAWLHDIGRLEEIAVGESLLKIQDSVVKFDAAHVVARAPFTTENMMRIQMKRENEVKTPYIGQNHASISARILEQAGVSDPFILLPVKYHGVRDLNNALQKDRMYVSLSVDEQKKVAFCCAVIRDADKMANLSVKAYDGMADASESLNPKFHGNCDLSYAALKDFFSNQSVNTKNTHTYLDTLLKFCSWAYDLYLPVSKKLFQQKYLNSLMDTILKQALNEKNGIKTGLAMAQPQSNKKFQDAQKIINAVHEHMEAYLCGEKSPVRFEQLSQNNCAIINRPITKSLLKQQNKTLQR